METKDVLLRLRTEKKMTQDELAEKVFVTRQAVSRWEKGETTPNVETLKLLSGVFDVSINTLLGSPRLLMTVVYIAALFTAENYVSYAAMLVVTGVCIALSRIPLKVILRGLKPLWIIIALTAVLNMFFTPGRELVSFWKITITYEGLVRAVFMVLRITMLIAGTFLLTYTTSPIALTDAMEILFGPLKKLKVPVHEMSMMMSMALRFIPTLIEETDIFQV